MYYLVAGVFAIFSLQTLHPVSGPWFRAPYLWAGQVLGLAVAGFGVALIRSGRKSGAPSVSAMLSMLVAILLFILSAAGIAIGIESGSITPWFLIDAGLQFMFVCWWAVACLTVGRVEPTSSST
jgi:hypothetical protein